MIHELTELSSKFFLVPCATDNISLRSNIKILNELKFQTERFQSEILIKMHSSLFMDGSNTLIRANNHFSQTFCPTFMIEETKFNELLQAFHPWF